MSQQFTFTVEKAEKLQQKARVALCGPAGSGKTYTALKIAQAWGQMIADERGVDVSEIKIAGIDTEHHTMRLYSQEPWVKVPFFVIELDPPFALERCTAAIHYLENWDADIVLFDSISHAWTGEGGALSAVDANAARYGGNTYASWRDVTPKHNEFVDSMVRCKAHIIVCARSKMEYALTQDGGKAKVQKLGMAPVQRDGMEYEFDVVGDLNLNHVLVVSKTRCAALDNKIIQKPGEELAKAIFDWLGTGAPPPPTITEQQEAHIRYLMGQLMPDIDTDNDAVVNNVLQKKGYPPLMRLAEEQATELIGIMENAAKKAESQAVKAPGDELEPPPEDELEPLPELEPEPEPEPVAAKPPAPTKAAPPAAAPRKKKEPPATGEKPWPLTTKVGEFIKHAKTELDFGMKDVVQALDIAEPDAEVKNITQTSLSYDEAWKAVESYAAELVAAAAA